MTNKLVIENLKFRPVRSIISIIAIGLEVTMMLTIVGLSEGMLSESRERARGIGADVLVRPPSSSALGFSSAPIPEKIVPIIENLPHVGVATGAINYQISTFTTLTGVDFDRFTRLSGGFRFISGGLPRNPDDLIIDTYYADQNNLKTGSTTKLMNRKWHISGVFEQGKLSHLIVPKGILQDLTGNPGRISQVFVKADNPKNTRAVIAAIREKLPVYPTYSITEFVSQFTLDRVPGLSWFIRVIVGLSVIIGFIVVFLSMYTAVLERTREIGILKALGATPGFVLGVLLRETFVLAVAGSIVGILLSYGSRALIMTLPTALQQQVVYSWWPIATGIALAGALLGSAYPGWRAARQDPIEALSYE